MKKENVSEEVTGFDLLHRVLCDMGCEILRCFDEKRIAFNYKGMPYMANIDDTALCIWQVNWYTLNIEDPYMGLLMDVVEKANLRKISGVCMKMGKPGDDGTVGVNCIGIMPNHIKFYNEHEIVKCIGLMSIMKEWVTSHFLLFVKHEYYHWPDVYATCYK